jgi:hypothetical protein
MDYQQIFGVLVRAFGLWAIILGLSAAATMARFYGGAHMIANYDWQTEGFFVAMYLVVGLFLLRKADLIITFAYPPQELTPPDQE